MVDFPVTKIFAYHAAGFGSTAWNDFEVGGEQTNKKKQPMLESQGVPTSRDGRKKLREHPT